MERHMPFYKATQYKEDEQHKEKMKRLNHIN